MNKNKIMKKCIWFILLLFFISCYPIQENDVIDMNETNLKSTDYDFSFSTIDDLISAIESSENIESKHIGIEGRKSYIYNCYEKLLEVASDSLWTELSYSKSPVMRYYAYKALFSRESANLQSVRNRLVKDTAQVCYHTMDMTFTFTLEYLIKENY
jgi:hypothetical protein